MQFKPLLIKGIAMLVGTVTAFATLQELASHLRGLHNDLTQSALKLTQFQSKSNKTSLTCRLDFFVASHTSQMTVLDIA